MPAVFYVFIALFLTGPLFAADPEPPRRVSVENRLYELRMIQATPGKLAALHALLRDHQIPLLEEHAVFTQGVFVPAGENTDQRVYLLVAAEGPGPMQDGWAGFRDDPKWLQALSKSEEAIAGKLVQREGSKRLVQTYWSPEFT